MKQVLIIEESSNEMKPINEGVNAKGQKEYVLGGTFTEFDVKNRNERIYTAEKFIPHLEELQSRISNKPGVVYGEFDHPENFDTALSRVSHRINNIQYLQEKNIVTGEIKLLNTSMGLQAKALVDDDCPIFVSSRAAGVTESNGIVTVKKLFTYDIVADPGFGSARMEMKSSLNESLGYNNKAKFRIFEMTDESKINQLFNMNQNDMVTKEMLNDYSNYVKQQLAILETKISQGVNNSGPTPDFDKMQAMLANYDSLLETQEKIAKYLDYVAETFSTLISENKDLKATTEKLIRHNDYLAENLENSINYSKYMANKLDKSIDHTDYVVENLEKSINHQNYLAEGMNKLVEYSNYISENLSTAIQFADYLAENLDASIEFSDYIAENLNHSIDFSDYIVENLESVIDFTDYIAENAADTQDYTKYIAENLDKHVGWSTLLAEKLNNNKVNEGVENVIDLPATYMKLEEQEIEEEPKTDDTTEVVVEEPITEEPKTDDVIVTTEEEPTEEVTNIPVSELESKPVVIDAPTTVLEEEPVVSTTTEPIVEPIATVTFVVDMPIKITGTTQTGKVLAVTEDGILVELSDTNEQVLKSSNELTPLDVEPISTENLTESINALILEAKKRVAAEESVPHFFNFLNESEIASFKSLTNEEKEKVVLTINESNGYFCKADVLKLMHSALNLNESLEEKLVKGLPTDLTAVFESLSNDLKKSIISQASFYDLNTADKVEHFWRTRKMQTESLNENKKTVANFPYIETNTMSDDEIAKWNRSFERFK